MAEVAGLVIGGVSLAGLFTACVDCFEYVQLGRQFGKDYQRSLLKLDILKLKLSRWADAVNETQGRYKVSVGSDKESQKVQEILGEIISIFADAEQVSKRYQTKARPDELVVHNSSTDLEPTLLSMHNQMQARVLKRQRRSTFAQKAGWALYDKKHFGRLIEDVTSFVDSLLELFPVIGEQQKQLSVEDAEQMKEEPALEALEDAATDVDELLRSSVQQVLASQGSHAFRGNAATEEARVQYGDQIAVGATATGAGHRYDDNKASGKARVQYGNIYGGRGVFADD